MKAQLAYTLRGDGERPLMLLHGFLGSGRNLASLARRLCERQVGRRAILPDLTGHGSSPPLPPDATLATLAEDVLALGRALSLPRPYPLLGHSLGGRVALVARQLAPAEVGDVTLLDIAPGPVPQAAGSFEPVLTALLAAPAEAESRDALRHFFAARGLPKNLSEWLLLSTHEPAGAKPPRVSWRFDRQALAALHRRTRDTDLWHTVEGARSTTRCIRGGRSPFVSDTDAVRLEAAGCRVFTLTEAGHFVHVDAQAALVDILVQQLPP